MRRSKTHPANWRTKRGQSLAVLILFLAVFLVGPLSFVAYELSLCNLAKQELSSCVRSAAIGASCTPVTDPKLDVRQQHQAVQKEALWLFQQNSVLGNSLANTTISNGIPDPMGADQSVLCFKFFNPKSPEADRFVTPDNKEATMVEIIAYYGFTPQFAKFFGIGGTWQISATAQAQLGSPERH